MKGKIQISRGESGACTFGPDDIDQDGRSAKARLLILPADKRNQIHHRLKGDSLNYDTLILNLAYSGVGRGLAQEKD
jgi:hypothetical protein